MDEFLESTNKSASFLDEALKHIDSALSSLKDAMLFNENEEYLCSITDNLSAMYDDIENEKTNVVDSADAIKDIVLDSGE